MDRSGFGLGKPLILLSMTVFTISIVRTVTEGYPYPLDSDAALFQHAGWYIINGATPYVDIWDIKPPLTFYTTILFAYLSLRNVVLLHFFSIIFTSLMGVYIVYLVGVITYEITEDTFSSLMAGISPLTVAGFHYLPSLGFRPKYFAIAFGLLGVLFQLRNKPLLSGIFAAGGAGFIQHAIIFAISSLLIAGKYEYKRIVRTLGGMFLITILSIFPILVFGDIKTMLVEVIVAPVSTSEPTGVFEIVRNFGKGLVYTGYSSIVIVVGILGIILGTVKQSSKYLWVSVGAIFSAIQIFILDFDSYPDLFYGLVFISIGVGIAIDESSRKPRAIAGGIVISVLLLSTLFLGGFGLVTNETVYTQSLDDSLESSDTIIHTLVTNMEDYFGAEHMRSDDRARSHSVTTYTPIQELYWAKQVPSSCHYRLSNAEQLWMEQRSESTDTKKCHYSFNIMGM